MASIRVKTVMEDVVILVKGHLIQINEDGSEKYLQPFNYEMEIEDFLKYLANKTED